MTRIYGPLEPGLALVALTLSLVISAPVNAQIAQAPSAPQAAVTTVDSRWLPWLGCWRPSEQRSPEEGAYVCVVPAGSSGVKMMTLAGDRIVVEETIMPDGATRSVDEAACHGSRRADWSRDGERLFSSAELTCDKEPVRKVSGLTLMSAEAGWIDVQVVTVAGRESVRVRRYRRSGDQPPEALRLPRELLAGAERTPAGPLTIDDIVEASAQVSSKAIEAALLELKTTFTLDSRALVAMDDAGVADSVIDLMVAMSYPKRFEVKRSSGGGGGSTSWAGFGGFYPGYSSASFDPYYSYYSPFGYNYYDYFGSTYYGPGAGVIYIAPGSGSGQPEPHGRVVNGGGYTQVRPRDPAADAQASGRVRSSDATGSDSGGSSSGSSGGSSGGGSVSSGGYSSGGGGGDSGHTAVPR